MKIQSRVRKILEYEKIPEATIKSALKAADECENNMTGDYNLGLRYNGKGKLKDFSIFYLDKDGTGIVRAIRNLG